MIKKLISLFILFCMISPYAVAASAGSSTHAFPIFIPAEDVPFGGGDNGGGIVFPTDDGGGGTSTGAIVGIAVGVGGGLLALGGLGYLIKRQLDKGLVCGQVFGYPNPIMPMCIDNDTVEKLQTQRNEYIYLNKAIDLNKTQDCDNAKYILVPDALVSNKSVNAVFFELPYEQDLKKVKVTMVSDAFEDKQVETKIYTNIDKDKLKTDCKEGDFGSKEVNLNNTVNMSEQAVVQSEGIIDYTKNKNYGALVISFDKTIRNQTVSPLRYALVVGFSK